MSVPILALAPNRKVSTRVVDLTPELAAALLGQNSTNNRNVRVARVNALARDMAEGRFALNGEAIQIDRHGRMINGQHRCLAVIQSGCTVKVILVEGLDPDVIDTIDMGQKRSVAQALAMKGETDATALAAISRRALMWDHGIRTNSAGSPFIATEREISEFVANNHDVRRAVDVARRARNYIAAPAATIGLGYFLCARIDAAAASMFYIDQLIDGLGLMPADPAHTLRLRFASGDGGRRRGRIAEADAIGYCLRAWNAFRCGERLSRLQAPTGGWASSNIPTPL